MRINESVIKVMEVWEEAEAALVVEDMAVVVGVMEVVFSYDYDYGFLSSRASLEIVGTTRSMVKSGRSSSTDSGEDNDGPSMTWIMLDQGESM
ncbi:hypothetical protein QYF36_012139 [Acer negundo]|nr:hypothetical protein QYF36_012139 [Acer negundo]